VRVRIGKALDAEIRGEIARAVEAAAQSFLFEPGTEALSEVVKDSAVEEAAGVVEEYGVRIPWQPECRRSDARRLVADRISVSCEDGAVQIDIRVSLEGLTCDISEERFVALRMLPEG